MELSTTNPMVSGPAPVTEHLSYKFQRLRERLRQAVLNGELAGKLPGERELARRFKANPKTLSKALTDLAAEGLLERSVGRGTYVRGTAPSQATTGRWLVLAHDTQAHSPLVEQVFARNPETEVVTAFNNLRPSFLDRFNCVIDLAGAASNALLHTLVVRGMSIVRVGSEPDALQTHAVLLDREHAASVLARQMVLAGHSRILVIENSGNSLSCIVGMTARRYDPSANVTTATLDDHAAITTGDHTAILCDGEEAAHLVRRLSETHPHLARLSLAAVGMRAGEPVCTGIYVTAPELAQAATELLTDSAVRKPTVLWLTGNVADRATIRPLPEPASIDSSARLDPAAQAA